MGLSRDEFFGNIKAYYFELVDQGELAENEVDTLMQMMDEFLERKSA
jgi:hypothetical protein